MEYKDKHGNPVTPGMVITNGAGLTGLVEDLGNGELGILCTNEAYRRNHPHSTCDEFYPLSAAALKYDWEVVS